MIKVHQSISAALGLFAATNFIAPSVVDAQYFQSSREHYEREVLSSSGIDSVIVTKMTTFEVPPINDSLDLVYHEPLPDSLMPKSAIVIGKITLQARDEEDIVEDLEETARDLGADWIVSFAEPRPIKLKSGNVYFRTSALLLRVLDPEYVNKADLKLAYVDRRGLNNYASVVAWHENFQLQMGAQIEQLDSYEASENDVK